MEAKDVSTLILSAAAIYAVYKFAEMPKDDRRHFIRSIKDRTGELLDDADATVEKVQNYMGEFKSLETGNWYDRLYLIRKMVKDLFGNPVKNRVLLISGVNQSVLKESFQ